MAKVKGTLTIDVERCKGCGVCVEACPASVLELAPTVNGKGYNYLRMALADGCTGCANCAIVCPDSCITVYREAL